MNLVRGFRDIFDKEAALFTKVETIAKEILEAFNFKEIRLPIIEKSELFARSIGENTDIVEKEMYSFLNSKGELLSLRPEATASSVRFYLEECKNEQVQKLYTFGAMFRKERPQKGRYRQFYQINAEVFGISSPYIDALMIIILHKFFKRIAILNLETKINSLGCPNCRPKFNEALLLKIQNIKNNLCENCQRRSEFNPLRILDCKNPQCKEFLHNIPIIYDFLCKDCKDHFETVKDILNEEKISYVLDNNLVRGLDYYRRTIFEIQTNELGAQNAVAGGGRYDGLLKTLGNFDGFAIGFAIGLDRVCEILKQKEENLKTKPLNLFIANLDEESKKIAFKIFSNLSSKIKVEMDFENKSLKSAMKKADKLNANFVLMIGENERKEGKALLRNMQTKEQVKVDFDKIETFFSALSFP